MVRMSGLLCVSDDNPRSILPDDPRHAKHHVGVAGEFIVLIVEPVRLGAQNLQGRLGLLVPDRDHLVTVGDWEPLLKWGDTV